MQTDPVTTDYIAEQGAYRTFQAGRLAEQEEERKQQEKEEEEAGNPMLVSLLTGRDWGRGEVGKLSENGKKCRYGEEKTQSWCLVCVLGGLCAYVMIEGKDHRI